MPALSRNTKLNLCNTLLMLNKSNIGSLFDRIANHYDALNHILSLGIDKSWRKKAVKGMSCHNSLLDVAIGTADLTIEILRQGKANSITGIDLSEQMMNIGKEKVAAKGFASKVNFLYDNALQMSIESSSFDAVTSSFGVRNFSDLDKGLSEMYRVLKPDGELMILELSYPSNPVLRFGYDMYFSHILPFIGKTVSHDKSAYTYLNKSVKHFIWGKEMCNHLSSVGFNNVSYKPLTFGIATIYRAVKS